MTDQLDAEHSPGGGEDLVFDWMLAPPEFVTRRQLRDRGLGPNRQGIAAWLRPKKPGRKLARLYDLRKAGPKRVSSPAQLESAAKAVREHQARAAERRGIARADLYAEGDPGPGWATPAPAPIPTHTHKEAKIMSDNTIGDAPMLGVPTSHNQRIEYLLVSVALHQARARRDRLERATRDLATGDPDSPEAQTIAQEIAASRAAAEQQLTDQTRAPIREVLADTLTEALVWHEDSPLAARELEALTTHYEQIYGLQIDHEALTVAVDPEFDADADQQFDEADAALSRAFGVREVLKSMNTPEHVLTAVSAWVAGDSDIALGPEQAGQYLASEQARREQLARDLASAGMRPQTHAGVEFIVDYARGDLDGTDLTKSPILVNPAEEVRGRVPGMLDRYARSDEYGATIAQEISVMTPADQAAVRQAGQHIAAGKEIDHNLWPGWVDRDALTGSLHNFARASREVGHYAEQLATGRDVDLDGVATLVSNMRRDRHDIQTMINADGVHPIEKVALLGVLDDINNGRTDETTLPEVLLADERSKKAVDARRHDRQATELSVQAVTDVSIEVEHAIDGPITEQPKVRQTIGAVGEDIEWVARGGHGKPELAQRRQDYDQNMGRLGRALAGAAVEVPARSKMRSMIDAAARTAGQLGRTRDDREKLWHSRIRTGTARAARQADAATQRAIVEAGHAKPAERACATRPTATTGRSTASGAGARIMQLHQGEAGR